MRRVGGLSRSVEWVIVAVQLLAVALLVGPPNLAVAGQFFGNHMPSSASSLALAGLWVWIASLVVVAGWCVAGIRSWRRGRAPMRHAGAIAVALGVVLLAIGTVKNVTGNGYAQCCGRLQSAQQLIQGAQP